MNPSPLRSSAGQQCLRHPHHAHHVRLEHAAPVLLVGLGHRLQAERAAGVVDQHRELGEGLRQIGDRGGISDVQAHRSAADLARHLLAALEPPGRGHDVEAGGGQRSDGRGADSAAGARDQRDSPVLRHRQEAIASMLIERVPLIGSAADQGGPGEGMERGTSMHGGRGIDRSLLGIGLALVAGAFLIAWLALPSGAIAKKHQKGKGLALKFKGSTQSDQALLSSGNVSVVVNSSKKRKLVLAVRGFGGGPALTDPLGVKAKAGKKKSVSLPLSSTGREVLQGCGANSLLLTAKTKGKKSKHGKNRRRRRRARAPRVGPRSPIRSPSATCSHARIGARSSPAPEPTACSRSRAITTPCPTPAPPPGKRLNLSDASHSGQQERGPRQSGGDQHERRIQPRGEHRHQGPGPRQPRGLPEDRRRCR